MRRLLLSLALAAALSAVGASSALAEAPAGAQKAPFFVSQPGGETFGFAVLNTPGDETTVTGEVSLHNGPSGTWEVFVDETAPPFVVHHELAVGRITPDEKGDANLHFAAERIPGTTTFAVVMVNVETEAEIVSAAAELD